jgi:hypothetical protein
LTTALAHTIWAAKEQDTGGPDLEDIAQTRLPVYNLISSVVKVGTNRCLREGSALARQEYITERRTVLKLFA